MYSQDPYNCRVEWGKRGAREAAGRGDIIIIVDVLSFSTAVTAAVHSGAAIYPFPPPINEEASAFAAQLGAELLLGRAEAAKIGRPSLSPVSFAPELKGNKFVMCSLNGAACTAVAAAVPALLAGSLLNATAVAETADLLQTRTGANITVIACGEHWNNPKEGENVLRPSLEDYLGAGAILSELRGAKSPEALVCIGAYEHSKPSLEQLIWDCGSGRELRKKGYEQDVRFSSQLDYCRTVPILVENHFVPALGHAQ
ncbi:2-phosphosulfolactate phosphatase [Bacillus sp. T33-2]|uniref:2-phosphosulfolactate phosphatase n=1 Tax=Bacillus sp. T33-2 TaxID=2054168 RepID=UPI000C7909F8|nr:2-phosphosulfolactate phosphatase [Bacillus sp. T33-2]PLR94148.1 2-phosphosulfolactate phosphatase [Bacillus sp. T33-2]